MQIKTILYSIILVITLLVLTFIFNNTLKEIEGTGTFLSVKIIKLFLVISGLIILTRIITIKKISSFLFLTFILLVSFFLRLWWIYTIDTEPISDFGYMLNAANGLLAGDTKRIFNSHYFDIASDNIPFTLYQTVVLYFFKTTMALKIFNVFFGTVIVCFIYRISQLISTEQIARITALITCFFPPFIIYTSVLTNQILSLLFILWALLVYAKKGNLIYIGLLLALANLIRPTAIIYLIGLFVFLLINNFFLNEMKFIKKIKTATIDSLKLVAPYFLLIFFVSASMETTGIAKHGLFYNPIPNYKLLVGLNHETKGNYSPSDNKLAYDLETYDANARSLIKERISDKEKLLGLFKDKFKIMWGRPDAGMNWAFTKNVENAEKYSFLKLFEQYHYLALIGCSIIFMLNLLIKKNEINSFYFILICTTFLGFVLIYIFIEIQTRYRYEIYPLILFMAGAGVATLYSILFPHIDKSPINQISDQ